METDWELGVEGQLEVCSRTVLYRNVLAVCSQPGVTVFEIYRLVFVHEPLKMGFDSVHLSADGSLCES